MLILWSYLLIFLLMIMTVIAPSRFKRRIHCYFEICRNSRPKIEIFDDFSWRECNLQQDLGHVRLLTIVSFVRVTIHDQIFSRGHIHLDVIELAGINWICQNVVPGNPLNGFFGELPIVESLLGLWLNHSKSVIFP